ncbi:MAG: HAD family phosphatase [Flavobacterium sp.]|nr:HAD family phosphatase [Pedobacter sp.]
MKNLKAILFDLDGTLIDSEYFHYECWNEILEEYNVALTFADWLKNYAGMPLPVNAKSLMEKHQIKTNLNDFIAMRENLFLERLKTKDISLMPYALEFIQFFHNKGLILSIVTASSRQEVELIFDRNGLRKYFSLIITRTDVDKSKPDPESYNICCKELNISKEQCIVFEDTENGIKSAVAAGITCYAIQSNVTEHARLSLADKLFLNLNEAKKYMLKSQLIALADN